MAADRHSAGPRKGGGPVAGIPSADDAGRALRGATRVLLRIVVLVGLVICGWLLGTATGQAHEAGPDDSGTAPDWVHMALARHDASPPAAATPAPTVASTPALASTPAVTPTSAATPKSLATPAASADNPSAERPAEGLLGPLTAVGVDAVAPVGALLPVPAPVPGVVLQTVQPLAAPLVDAVGRSPVVAQVLGPIAPRSAERPVPAPVAATDALAAPSPAEPAPTGAGPPPVPAPPPAQVYAPALPAVSSPGGAADLPTRRLAGSAAGEQSTPPVPASPSGTTGTSCPPGSTGANTVAQAAYAAVLGDGAASADTALMQRRLWTDAGGLPRCVAQQPSTSPD